MAEFALIACVSGALGYNAGSLDGRPMGPRGTWLVIGMITPPTCKIATLLLEALFR